MDERVAQYLCLYFCLFQTTVQWHVYLSGDADLDVAGEGIGLTQITELTQFPSEAALVSDGHAESTFRPFRGAWTGVLRREEGGESE